MIEIPKGVTQARIGDWLTLTPVDGDGNFASPLPYPVTTGALGDSPPSRPDLLFSPSGTAARTDLMRVDLSQIVYVQRERGDQKVGF